MKTFRIPCFFLLIFFLFLNAPLAQSQINPEFGALAGINAATQNGDTYDDLGFRLGCVFGLFANIPHGELMSFHVGLNYSQEGARNADYDFSTFSTVIYDQKIKYDYITIPLLIRYRLCNSFHLLGGPRLGININAEEVRDIKSGEPSPTDNSAGTRDQSDRIKTFYPGLLVGGEYAVTDRVSAHGRAYYSFFDNVKKNAGDSEGTYPLMFQLSVGYLLKAAASAE